MAKRQIKEKHIHSWTDTGGGLYKCDCGKIALTLDVYYMRKKAWDEYYERVKNTEAYQNFQRQKKAFLEGDWATFKDIVKRSEEMLSDLTYCWLDKLPFPDPVVERQLGRLEIYRPFEEGGSWKTQNLL